MATDNSSSLSKDQTIKQLRETIGQLETVIQKLEKTNVVQLSSSEPLQSLLTTTLELEAIIASEVVTQEAISQETKNQVEQEQISQEVDAISELTTLEIEQEAVLAEQINQTQEKPDEQSESNNSFTTSEETKPEAIPDEQVIETIEQPEIEALDPKTPETVKTAEPPQEPVKKAVKTTKKPKSNKQQKSKPKNQASKKKKKGWLVGVVVAAIALIAITLTLKFAPISEFPQLLANNSVVNKLANSLKTRSSITKAEPDLPLEPPIEIEKTTEYLEKIDPEKIASQPSKDDQVDESTQAEPEQFDSTPTELDAEPPLFATNPEPAITEPEIAEPELEPESEQALTQEVEPEEPLVVVEETKPITKLTSEQNLIVNLGKKADNLAERYDDDLILSIKPDFAASVVSVTLSDDWYELLENRQDRLLGEMFRRSQQLEFDKLMITDSDNNLIARSPVIGQEMVVFRRTS